MDDTSFLQDWAPGNVTLAMESHDGEQSTIPGLDRDVISERSPLLGLAIEDNASGGALVTISVASHAAGVALVRYLYLGDYITADEDENDHPQFLIHMEVLCIADSICCPELKGLTMGRLNYNVQQALKFPAPPPDLVQTLIFIYVHLAQFPQMLSTMLNYCVAAFTAHKLSEDAGFKRLAETHECFLSDLSKVNIERAFDSPDIPKMAGPIRPRVVEDTYIADTFADHHFDSESIRSRSPTPIPTNDPAEGAMGVFDLPIRVRDGEEEPDSPEPASPASSTTDDGFVLVNGRHLRSRAIDESDSEWSFV